MKKLFSKDYLTKNKGCYYLVDLKGCSFMKLDVISIMDILNSEIPLKDKGWFVLRKCELSPDKRGLLAYLLAVSVAPIYNKKYPGDSRVNDCLSAIEKYRRGGISLSELRSSASAAASAAASAYAASDAASDAYAAASDAYAASDAASDAYAAASDAYAAASAAASAYAASDAAADAYAAAYASAAAAGGAKVNYKEIVLNVLINFVKTETD